MKPRFVFLAVAIALVVGAGVGFAAHTLTGHKSKTASAPVTRDVARTTPVASTSNTDSLTQIYAKDAPGIVTVTVSGRDSSSGSSTSPFGRRQRRSSRRSARASRSTRTATS